MSEKTRTESNTDRLNTVGSGHLQPVVGLRANPRGRKGKDWEKPATYPADVIVCPLCALPETTKVYKKECHCWDD